MSKEEQLDKLLKLEKELTMMFDSDLRVAMALLEELNDPLMSVSLILPENEIPVSYPSDIGNWLNDKVELIIDGDFCQAEPTTIIDCLGEMPTITRARNNSGTYGLFMQKFLETETEK